ncbi:MAG: hypothetical protein FWC09_08845 [Lachnospiraceae bacterium]|nr:hypothetical protein [Lachnospiraceae bacterium]
MEEKKSWSVASEIRAEQKAALKGMPFKKKFAYFWEYYRYHVIVTVISLFVIISAVNSMVNRKDYSLYAMMINSYMYMSDEIAEEFNIFADIDTNYYTYIDTDTTVDLDSFSQYEMATSQKIAAVVMAGDLDLIVSDGRVFLSYAENSFFGDLREILSEAELKKYEDKLFYIDMDVVNKRANPDSLDELMEMDMKTPDEWSAEINSRFNKNGMKEPIPVGIFVTDSPLIELADGYPGYEHQIFGFIINSFRKETAKEFLEFMYHN